jgi:hypothetical protein
VVAAVSFALFILRLQGGVEGGIDPTLGSDDRNMPFFLAAKRGACCVKMVPGPRQLLSSTGSTMLPSLKFMTLASSDCWNACIAGDDFFFR